LEGLQLKASGNLDEIKSQIVLFHKTGKGNPPGGKIFNN
jgi:hypothetical protein